MVLNHVLCNARSHTWAESIQYSTGQNSELHTILMTFFLFQTVITELRGQRFATPEEAVDALTMFMELPQLK